MTIETELPAVKVKALIWELREDGATYHAQSIVGRWAYWEGHYLPPEGHGGIKADDPAGAAQADYERRIRSALVPSTSAELVTREDLCQFIRDKAESHKGMLQDDFWPFLTMYLLDNFSIQRTALKELGKGDGR